MHESTPVLLLRLTSEPSLSVQMTEYLKSPASTTSLLTLAVQVRVMFSQTSPATSGPGDITIETSVAGTAQIIYNTICKVFCRFK